MCVGNYVHKVPRMAKRSSRVNDAVTNWAFTAGWAVSKKLPERAARRAFQSGADLLWSRNAGGVERLTSNLARVKPELSQKELGQLSKEGMRSYMRYWCEAFRLPTLTPSGISSGFELRGVELLDQAMADGTGAVMIPGHMANWDIAGAWAAQRYGSVTTVAEQLKPKDLFDQFLAFRESLGMEVLPLGESDVMRTLVRRLRAGRLVALLGDRDMTKGGVEVEFFGATASMPAGPATISIMTGAPLHPVTMHYEDDKAVGVVYPRVEVPDFEDRGEQVKYMTQQIAQAFEIGITKHPEDWHMLQRVWINES